MLHASLSAPAHWKPFIKQSIFERSLQWIAGNAASIPDGIHELGEPGWFVNVHGYTTQSRELCAWENHLETIDIQYMIEGLETIDVIPVEGLGEPATYKPESDTQKFGNNDEPFTQVVFRTGAFVFFFPGEAHRPKVAAGSPLALRKLVVKVPVRLLASE